MADRAFRLRSRCAIKVGVDYESPFWGTLPRRACAVTRLRSSPTCTG